MRYKRIDNFVLAIAVIMIVLGLVAAFRPTAADAPENWALSEKHQR